MRSFMATLAGLAILGGCASTESTAVATSASVEAQQVGESDDAQAICKRVIERGSSSIKRVCKPASEWDALLAASEQQIAASGDEMVCKRTVIAGSRFPKLVCMTADEWQALREDTQDRLKRIQRVHTYVQ